MLRSALFSADSRCSRVTAVVVDDLPQSCVAAVSRLVLVGRGGVRLHEEVFLTGIRLRGQAMAEAKVERLARRTPSTQTDLRLANRACADRVGQGVERARLAAAQPAAGCDDPPGRGAPGAGHRSRSSDRQEADATRAREIFAAFRRNLPNRWHRLREAEAAQERCCSATTNRPSAAATSGPWRTGWPASTTRNAARSPAIGERYADIRPHVSAAAVVFALSAADVEVREDRLMTAAAVPDRPAPANCTVAGCSWSTRTARSCPSRY